MKKATLKHVANQYILIVDERPRHNEWWYHPNGVINNINNELNDPDYNDCCRIIAAENLESVKGIRIEYNNHLLKSKQSRIREMLDGKEVQVTECKDYWLVRL